MRHGDDMSELTVQDGKLVVRNGTLGTGVGCCCGEDGEECVCPADCADGLQISLGGSPFCYESFYGDFTFINTDGQGCSGVLVSVSMQCTDGVWMAYRSMCGPGCFVSQETTLAVGDDCLPIAGEPSAWQTISEFDDGCCPEFPPVTIVR